MKANVITGDVAYDIRQGCFISSISRPAREVLASAIEIADDAAVSLIESHGRRTDMEGRWYDIAGEPVEQEVAYLYGRGLLTFDPLMPSIVQLLEPEIVQPHARDCSED